MSETREPERAGVTGSEEPLDPARYCTLLRLAQDPEARLVISLGGGSLPGLCGNLALVRILEQLGLRGQVDELWGTSAGAVIGGAWATGTTAAEMYGVIVALDHPGTVKIPWVPLALSLLFRPFGKPLPDGLVSIRNLAAAIRKGLKVERIEDCEIPFRAIACTDDGHATRKIFRRGPLLPAIIHSMSLPGILRPEASLKEDEIGYYDGGLVEKTPLLSPIAEHGRLGSNRRLVLLGTHYSNETRRARVRGFIGRFLQSLNALENLAWSYQLAEARARKDALVMILNPCIEDAAMFDFGRVKEDYEYARGMFLAGLEDARIGLTFGLE